MQITIQFDDGPFDGTVTFESDNELDEQALMAWTFYQLTDGCQLGRAAIVAPPAAHRVQREPGTAATMHPYRVVHREQHEGNVFARAAAF